MEVPHKTAGEVEAEEESQETPNPPKGGWGQSTLPLLFHCAYAMDVFGYGL